jgi:hypothetical protein
MKSLADFAQSVGSRYADKAWLLACGEYTANPHYAGPAVPHPDDIADRAAYRASFADARETWEGAW